MHAFKNALIPVFTLAGVNMVVMVNAAVIIEVMFAWPGIGRLLFEGIFQRDFPLVQGVVIMAGFMIVGVNLVVDILYAFIDPRIRLDEVGWPWSIATSRRGRETTERPCAEPVRQGGCARRRCSPLVILGGLFALAALFADFIAPYDPTLPVKGAKMFAPPFWMEGGSTATPLGTDFQGRDILSRLIYGARVSLIVGLMGTLVAGGIGTAMGILSGYVGGWVDQIIMRVTDAWLALPAIVFAIFLAAMVGPSMWNIIVILGAVYWTRYARVIRGEVLSSARAGVREAGRDRRRQQAARDQAAHPAERHEHGDGAGEPHRRRRHHRRGVAELSRRRRAAARSPPGASCSRRRARR